jgi:Kdo2-lipid IVA lauroyltransferase/acyltransferase
MYAFLYSLVYLVSLIPRKVGLRIGDVFGLILYYSLSRRRGVALQNLAIAFGDHKDPEERRRIAKKSFQFMGRHFFEACYLIRTNKEKLASYVQIKGVTHYEQARAQGRGLVCLTGHFGCWELLAAGVAYFVAPGYLVAKPLDFTPAEKLVQTIRGASGNQSITKEKSMRRLIQALAQGSSLAILLDQNIDWKDGVFVPFFNKRACTNKGLALLVRKTQVPVLPVFIIDQGRGQYLVEIKPALPWLSFGDRTKEIEENTAQYNQVIETMARQYPDHYFWVHQRWKTRPYQPWPRET